MIEKRKVTFTFYTDSEDPTKIDQLATARKIRIAAISAGETMAQWARELGVSRQYVYQAVNGVNKNQRVRDFIESRLNETFWLKEASK
jgi:DNA-binding phage protein